MQRRDFVGAGLGGTALAVVPRQVSAEEAGAPTRLFEVTTTIDLSKASGPGHLWVPVFARQAGGQRRMALNWSGEAAARLVRDAVHGAEMLHARWQGEGPGQIRIVERVATWDRRRGPASPELSWVERTRWTMLGGTPADQAQAKETAWRIAGGLREPEARLRAIYDWTIASTWRDAGVAGCGPGDAAAMLREGRMGGKCADINGLVVCLSRAAGIPARELYGVRLADSARFRSMGRSGDVTKAQHCRAEAWLPSRGWFAIDPADVRKVVLEEKLPIDSAPVRALADDLFGGSEGNWAGYNDAAPLALPEAPREPSLRYLMYPTALTANGEVNPLDPANFAYRIAAREIVAR